MGFVIGTAGHIDHGKSTLVKALTGVNPDRLTEEQKRGITIELGFARLELGDGLEASFVDVPGHEALVRTMVAGATGIDAVMLVVAADEGIMPQTREHLDIVELLGLERGLVALTKSDRVDEDLLELAHMELSETLSESSLASVPILPVSGITGAGLEELRAALVTLVREGGAHAESAGRPFRLPVDRVFSMRGFGTVVTGSAHGGRVEKGEALELLPGGQKVKVRGLQMHGAAVDFAEGSNRLAVNLQNVEKDAIRRGQVLATAGTLSASSMLDVRVRLLPEARSIDNGSEIAVLSGTAEELGRGYWIGAVEHGMEVPAQIAGGEEIFAQLRLAAPMAVERGDRLILRRTAPDRTVGGALVVDPSPRRFRRREATERAQALRRLSAAGRGRALRGQGGQELVAALSALAALESRSLLTISSASLRLGVGEKALAVALDEQGPEALVHAGLVALPSLPRRWVHRSTVARLAERLSELLAEMHAALPLREGFAHEDLKGRLKTAPELLELAVEVLRGQGRIEQRLGLLAAPGHAVELDPGQRGALETLERALKKGGFDTPDPNKLLAEREDANELMSYLLQKGEVVRVNRKYVLHGEVHARLLGEVRAHLEAKGSMDPNEFKEITGLSRKLAIPLLEHLDSIGLTRRQGNSRVLKGA